MDTKSDIQYQSPGGVNYSVLDAVYRQHDTLELNPDVFPYDPSRDLVPGFVNGTGLFNGTGGFDIYDVSSVSPNGSNITNVTSGNETSGEFVPLPLWQIGFFGLLAAVTILLTIVGNAVVILSFYLERAIRQPTNYFIASLAMSDLLIGTMSMPFYTVYLLSNQTWTLGYFMCDLWLSVDYTVCLTSIYTVFAITVDRYCSVTIPAKYRNWRSEQKVYIIIACTWFIPIGVFFTSIFGWQYFVGKRTVGPDMCYVQFLEEAIFSAILQVSYFWATLVVMIVLYTGIYKVALELQRKAEAKRKKMTSLVSIAGQTMTRIGIGMSQQGAVDARKLFSPSESNAVSEGATEGSVSETNDVKKGRHNKANNNHGASSTSFSLKNPEREDDRSSSPAFPSDTDPSSQSPKRSPLPKSREPSKHRKRARSNSEKESKPFKLQKPPKGRKARRASNKGQARDDAEDMRANNNISVSTGACDSIVTTCSTAKPSSEIMEGHDNPILSESAMPPDYGTLTPNAQSPSDTKTLLTRDCGVAVSQPMPNTTGAAVGASPEQLAGVKYIDQESLESLQSSDNLKNLAEAARVLAACKEATTSSQNLPDEPDSPIWKMRDSVVARNRTNENSPAKSPLNNRHSVSVRSGMNTPSNTPVVDSVVNSPVFTPSPNHLASAGLTVETRGNNSRPITQIARTPDADNVSERGSVKSRNKGERRGGGGSPLSTIVKTVKRSKRDRRNKSKEKMTKQTRSENRARKALRTITIILGAFVLCWTPWHILSLIIGFTENHGVVLLKLYDISYWLCYLNSPINPLCYAFANAQFKKTFIRIMKFDWKRR